MSVKVRTPETNPMKPTARIFLAGSIENGVAENWQDRLANNLTERYADLDCNVIINNPRRDNWDSSIDPTSNDPALIDQINWELDELDRSDVIAMYFDPNTKSPISLLELGLYKDRNIFVYCPDEFWRSANVRVTCERFGIPVFTNKDTFMGEIACTLDFILERRGW